MSAGGYELRLLEDTLHGGASVTLGGDLDRVFYVVHGEASRDGIAHADDEAWHRRGPQTIQAGATGVTLWRYELAPAGLLPETVDPSRGRTREKLRCPLAWPVADRHLIRADSVSFPPGGCAFLHTHQGPGIRCLIDGGIRIDTEGRSTSYGPGGAWFESGPEPVFAQAAADRPSRFIRVMVLPAALHGRSSIAYVNAADRDKQKSQTYKGYVDEPIEV